jgi:hypothetical protein
MVSKDSFEKIHALKKKSSGHAPHDDDSLVHLAIRNEAKYQWHPSSFPWSGFEKTDAAAAACCKLLTDAFQCTERFRKYN